MAAIEPDRHRRTRHWRCASRTCAVYRSGLEPERGRLAVLPEQGNCLRHARRRQIGGDCSAAALLGRQCLDQHGAGDRGLSPPRHCDEARRCLPRRGDTARPDDLAGRHAGGCRCLRSARLHPDAAIAPAAACEAPGSQGDTAAFGRQPRCVGRARCQRHGIRPQHIAVGIRCAVRAPALCPVPRRWP